MFSKFFKGSSSHGSSLTAKAVIGMGVLGMMAGASSAKAGIVYQDNFARGTTGTPIALNASTPSPTDTGSATWTAGTSYTTNGTEASDTGVMYQMAYLPLSVASNTVYTLSVTLTPTSNVNTNQNWLAMGFGGLSNEINNTSYDGGAINNSNEEAWLLYGVNGSTQSFYGGGTSHYASGKTGTAGVPDTFTITLNSSTGAVAFSDALNLLSGTGTLTPAEMANISQVNIGSDSAVGNFQAFTLSTPSVPEPASLGLLAVGGLGLLLVGKRRHA